MELSKHQALWIGRSKESGGLYVAPEKPNPDLYDDLILVNQVPEGRLGYADLEAFVSSLLNFIETSMGVIGLVNKQEVMDTIGSNFPLWNGFLQSLPKTFEKWEKYVKNKTTKKG